MLFYRLLLHAPVNATTDFVANGPNWTCAILFLHSHTYKNPALWATAISYQPTQQSSNEDNLLVKLCLLLHLSTMNKLLL